MGKPTGIAAALVLLIGACGPATPISTVAYRPTPNVVSSQVYPGLVQIDVAQVPEGKCCAHTEDFPDLCVTDFRKAYFYGLQDVARAFFSGSGPRYVARFVLVEFAWTPAAVSGRGAVVAVQVQMRWQFTLTDETGRNVVALARTTVGPKPAFDANQFGGVVAALMNATLEEIARALAQPVPPQASPPPAAPPPAPAAVPTG
jgi:hypothetical protein